MAGARGLGSERLQREMMLSTLVHQMPRLLERPARFIVGLDKPTDDLLRWRLRPADAATNDRFWARIAGDPDASANPRTWSPTLLYARRGVYEKLLALGGVPAVAYRSRAGEPIMVGTKELGTPDEICRRFLALYRPRWQA